MNILINTLDINKFISRTYVTARDDWSYTCHDVTYGPHNKNEGVSSFVAWVNSDFWLILYNGALKLSINEVGSIPVSSKWSKIFHDQMVHVSLTSY
jgi:hypothetical protein